MMTAAIRIIGIIGMIAGTIYAVLMVVSMLHRLWISRRMKWLSVLAVLVLPVGAHADQYLNCGSTESTINSGTGPNGGTVLMCDDFEDGNWYVTNADTSGGRNNTANDGWAGSIFAPDDAQGYARCGSLGANGSNCTATSGNRTGPLAQAFHFFGPAETKYNEIYHRWYVKFNTGYFFDHEKLVFYQHDENVTGQVNVIMTPFSSNTFDQQVSLPDIRVGQNQGNNLNFTTGHWYYIEVHVRLDNPLGSGNGLIETWADDCGTNGLGCTGSGTLRLSYTGNIKYDASHSLGVIHHENWCNNCSGEVYNDQIVVSTARIGPMGASSGGGGTASSVMMFVEWAPVAAGVLWHLRQAILSGVLACWVMGGALFSLTAQKTKHLSYTAATSTMQGITKVLEKVNL